MHLTKMRIGGEPPFTQEVLFNLDERVNLFVGPNASGKSTILLMLADYLIGQDKTAKRPIAQGWQTHGFISLLHDANDAGESVEEWASRLGRINFLSASADWVGTRQNPIRRPDNPPTIYIGSIREGLSGISDAVHTDGHGDTIDEVLAGRFSGSQTMYACNLLADELWNNDIDEARPYARVVVMDGIELADACGKAICDEIVKDARSYNYIPGQDIRDYLHHPLAKLDNIIVLRMMGVNTTDIRNFKHLAMYEEPSYSAYHEDADSIPIYLGHLSSGTEGTLLWIRWLALKMMHHYEFADGWEKQPAILLIDEIENHLHPTWQRRVIPALLRHFPGLQIFATTHSPFVVAGLRAGQVHLLNRDASGVITASTNTEDIIGWTADEILRVFMGVDDPTDDDTAKAARKLRQLRDAGPHPDESQEEQRQARMQELRQLVNRELLAGSVRAAEEERFAENLAAILERYRQSRDLNQENG